MVLSRDKIRLIRTSGINSHTLLKRDLSQRSGVGVILYSFSLFLLL